MVDVIGGASTTSRQPGRMLTDLRARGADACYVFLDNGQLYTDWQAGLHGNLYGYSPAWWERAIYNAIDFDGPVTSIPHENEQRLANRLADFYPDVEAVRFMLRGSDPCGAVAKLARAATGRDKLISFGYHGTASAYAKAPARDEEDNSLGTLQAERDAYANLEWLGDYTALERAALVIVECPPVDGGQDIATAWLNNLADDAHCNGALFVLDEVVTGFRYGRSGAAGWYDLLGKVDLYCFGKTLGNGFPVAALAGKRDIMQWLVERPGGGGRVHHSSTFNAEPIGLAVALAFLQELDDNPPWVDLYAIGAYLKDEWNGLDLPYKLVGHPTRPIIKNADERFDDLRRHLFERRHIIVPHPWYATTAHTMRDVDDLVEMAEGWT